MTAAAAAFSGSLDPIETNRPGAARAVCSQPAGASGEWSPGWSSCSSTLPRMWATGWDRGARCPPAQRDAAPRGGWREVGTVGGASWRDLHERRRRVVQLLRRAGYVARHRWSRVDTAAEDADRARWVYESGPAAGCRAVDPWELAAEVGRCSAAWYAQARITGSGELRAVALPRACGRAHLCPVCASRASGTMARALRSLTGAGSGALVTLTHRDAPGRSLAAELDRLRDGIGRLWNGRARAEWRSRFGGWWYGIETTYNVEAGTWHVHAHLLLQLAPGVEPEAAAEWVGLRWLGASAEAAEAAGLPARHGWSPVAGGVTWDACSVTGEAQPGSWQTPRGGWWRPVDLSNGAEVYQTCKYPTPAVELPPVQLAEFCAAAHGRRWHDGGGAWRGVRARAAELAHEPDAEAADAYDIGANVSRCGPRDVPELDTVAPGLGVAAEPTPPELVPGVAWFTLSKAAPLQQLGEAAGRVGGWLYSVELGPRTVWRLGLPASYVGALVHEWAAASAAAAAAKAAATAEARAEVDAAATRRRERATLRRRKSGRPDSPAR